MTVAQLDFKKNMESDRGVLFYFATMSCAVGEALEPKVRDLIKKKFPQLVFHFVDMNLSPELCASQQVFVEPTILLFIDGKESLRKSRHINLAEFEKTLDRIYHLAFD